MPQDVSHDVVSIREWLAKQSYLPQDLDDLILKKFLHSCYGSLERTKKCIERFCVTRSNMAEVYTDRDPLAPKIETAFSITNVSTYVAGDKEILIHQVDDPTLDNYVFYDVLKAFTLQADHWLKTQIVFPEMHIIILDIKDYLLKIIPKVNIMFYRDFLTFLLEGMPVRVKQVHMVNCPSFYDYLYSLIKPALPEEIRSIIHVHTTPESLHKHIDKQYLPQEYGGDAESMKDQHRRWVDEVKTNRAMFLNDNLWKANLKLKPKESATKNAMSGSFRTLSID